MTEEKMNDPFWDEFGIAWCAVKPEACTPALAARLRWQSFFITASLAVGLPLGAAALLLGLYTIALGLERGAWFFVTRGTGLLIVSGLVLYAWFLMRPVKAGDPGRAMQEMLALVVARLERMLAVVRLGFYACVAIVLFGLTGAMLRIEAGKPMQGPLGLYLAITALCAIGLYVHGRAMRAALGRYKHLQRMLDAG